MFTACPISALPTRRWFVSRNVLQRRIRDRRRKLLAQFALLAFLFAQQTPDAAAEDKTDLVVMNNGDRLVGEIKSMDYGQLQFKASYMASSVILDWSKVTELKSTRRFRVEFADGVLSSGPISRLSSAAAAVNFEVAEVYGTYTRGAYEVVSIEPLERSIWSRFRGSADVGLTLEPQISQTTWTGNVSLDFPAEKFRVDSQASSYFNSQESGDNSVRQSFSLSYYQYLSRNWFLLGMNQFLKDNQLNLDLRSTLSAGGGRFLMHSNRRGLSIFGGMAATNEKYFDTTTNKNGTTAEALTGMEFYMIRFASSQIKSKLLVYPSLSDWGRVRMDWQSSFSWEIWSDVYWKMSILENYDSRPPEGASHNDFTMTTSFGISF